MTMTTFLNHKAETSIAQDMLAEFERELGTTRRFLERVPDDSAALVWRPHEKSMSTGQLALHIAEVPRGVLMMSLQEQAAPPEFGVRPQPANMRQVFDLLGRGAEYVRRTLPTIDNDRMRETFTIAQGGTVVMSMPRAAFLRAIMLNHWYHHRGQLGVHLRLLGAKVPSSYGPSADE